MNIKPKDAWVCLDSQGEVGVTCVVIKDKIVLTNRFNRIELTPDQFRELYDWLTEWEYVQLTAKYEHQNCGSAQ